MFYSSLMEFQISEFLESFVEVMKSKKDEMKERLLHGTPNQLHKKFEKYFDSHWIRVNMLVSLLVSFCKL
jgi:hypothetical protein